MGKIIKRTEICHKIWMKERSGWKNIKINLNDMRQTGTVWINVVQRLGVSSSEYSYSEEKEKEEEDDDDKNNDDDKVGNIFSSWASTSSQEGLRRPS